MSSIGRKISKILLQAALAYLGVGIVLYLLQDRLLFQPGGSHWRSCDPRQERIAAFEIPSAASDRVWRGWHEARPGAKGRLLLFHGNGGLACDRMFYRELIGREDLEIIWFEYPGYDGSTLSAPAMLAGALEIHDHFQRIVPLPTLALGESLGSGIATYLASQRELAGLILFAPYTSIAEVAQERFWFYPVAWMIRHGFPAHEWARHVDEPVFAFQGTADRVIPHAISLEQKANFRDIRFFAIPHADHNDWTAFAGGDFLRALRGFVSDRLAPSLAPSGATTLRAPKSP